MQQPINESMKSVLNLAAIPNSTSVDSYFGPESHPFTLG